MRTIIWIALISMLAACTAPKFLTSNRFLGKDKIVRTVVQQASQEGLFNYYVQVCSVGEDIHNQSTCKETLVVENVLAKW